MPKGLLISELVALLERARDKLGDVPVINAAYMSGVTVVDDAGDHVEIE